MLRITRLDHGGGAEPTWKLEGNLVGAWVEELRRVAEATLAEYPAMALDLSEVSFVNGRGVELLRELAARSVRLERPSGFVRELLKGGA